jgi:competence protein ComEC
MQVSLPRPVAAFAAALIFFLAIGMAVADEAPGSSESGTAASAAVISYVDVGQGDAVVIRVGKKIIVSDAGELNPQSVDTELHKLGATKIDVAILSHPHKDHVKNFLDLLEIYEWPIKLAVLSHSAQWSGTKTNRLLMKALRKHGVRLSYVTAGDHFSWGGAFWEILSPPANRYVESFQVANSSVVYVLRVKGIEFLFTGDIGAPVATEVAKRWRREQLGHATVFLATHHGSANGSTPDLLTAITPKWAVLSTGPNSYKHPSPAAILRLEQSGASIWCTAVNGTVTARVSAKGPSKLACQPPGAALVVGE